MDIINLLPQAVANQIAAGEVVQRPASVVKELMENAVDAGAASVEVIVKDGGKSLIQVIDDGSGMSAHDMIMAFKRHATSKIKNTGDLFSLSTFGFRGEALPSIASVAEVEIKSREKGCETGNFYRISASVQEQKTEECAMSAGTAIKVKELFYNLPARRKFLKSEKTEFRNIMQEFIRVALTHTDIGFKLVHDGKDIYQLPQGTLRQRIANIFGKNIEKSLLPLECSTSLIRISGYICTPEYNSRKKAEQFFFANGRFMRHPLFHKALTDAYTGLITPEQTPSYFIFFETDPGMIDVNIHPAKTEVKFQHESDCFQILLASVKEVLGKFNIGPAIDFDMEGEIEYSDPSQDKPGYIPGIRTRKNYNPFNASGTAISPAESDFQTRTDFNQKQNLQEWEKLFQGMEENKNNAGYETELLPENETFIINWAHSAGSCIIASIPAGIAVIDRKAAHYRILYEKLSEQLKNKKSGKQTLLFPETLDLNKEEYTVMEGLLTRLKEIGYDCLLDGSGILTISTTPSWDNESPSVTIARLLDDYMNGIEEEKTFQDSRSETFIKKMARTGLVNAKDNLSDKECEAVIYELLCCDENLLTPDGKKILTILKPADLRKLIP